MPPAARHTGLVLDGAGGQWGKSCDRSLCAAGAVGLVCAESATCSVEREGAREGVREVSPTRRTSRILLPREFVPGSGETQAGWNRRGQNCFSNRW